MYEARESFFILDELIRFSSLGSLVRAYCYLLHRLGYGLIWMLISLFG